MGWEHELEVAREVTRQSAELALAFARDGFHMEMKADASPVTEADRASERLMAKLIDEAFPDDGLLGEEGTAKESRNGRRWIIDPIDGTRDYVRGNPLWSVLLGLEVDGAMQAGVVRLPALGRTYFAARGSGAYRDDTRILVSSIDSPANAVLSANSLQLAINAPFADRLMEWMSRFWAVRSLGGSLDAMLVASGQLEVWMEPRVAPWDLAAVSVIVEEAGGKFFDFSGAPTIYGGTAVGCAPGLERHVRDFLGVRTKPQP